MLARAAFERGVAAYKDERFEDALAYFSEAIELERGRMNVYEARAVVLEKLNRIPEALKDARKVIELSPQSYQGYLRSARLFYKMERIDSAMRMISLSLPRINDSKRLREVEALRADIEAAQHARRIEVSQKTCHIALLPVEILSDIMILAVSKQHSFVTKIASVCRHWRGIAVDIPHLWRSVELGAKDPLGHLKRWTERSSRTAECRGITDLKLSHTVPASYMFQILEAWTQSPRVKGDFHEPLSLSLDESTSVAQGSYIISWLRMRKLPSRLRSLRIRLGTSGAAQGMFWSAIVHSFASPSDLKLDSPVIEASIPLEHLILHSIAFPRRGLKFTTLRTLDLRNIVGPWSLPSFLEVLADNPLLETVVLECVEAFLLDSVSSTTLLPELQNLSISGGFNAPALLEFIEAPNLSILHIARCSRPICTALLHSFSSTFSRDSRTTSIPLKELRVDQCGFKPDILIKALQYVPNLRILQLSGSGENVNRIVYALSGVDPSRMAIQNLINVTNAPRVVSICPSLEHVDFSRCSELKGGPVRDLVKSRLPADLERSGWLELDSAVSPAEKELRSGRQHEPSVLPLKSIVLDGCLKVEVEILPWLRTKVQVSCVYETKAQAQRRRRREI